MKLGYHIKGKIPNQRLETEGQGGKAIVLMANCR